MLMQFKLVLSAHCSPIFLFQLGKKDILINDMIDDLILIQIVFKQEGWLSPTERASVSAISLRHIIWLPQESHAGMLLPSAVLRAGIWLRQESLRHILASPAWVRPWDNCGKCYMDGKRIQCLSNALQHVPICLQPFLSNSTRRKFKSSPF